MEANGDEAALMPRFAKLSDDMKSFVGGVQDLVINDEDGKPIRASNHERRFFEAAWCVPNVTPLRHYSLLTASGCIAAATRTTSATRPGTLTTFAML